MSAIVAFSLHAPAFTQLFLQSNTVFDQTLGPHHMVFGPLFSFFIAVGTVLAIIPYWFIFKKAGFSPWLAILMILPLVNLIVLYVVAFSHWRVTPVTGYPAATGPGGIYQPPA